MIPVYIICFNNGYYVKNTVNQLINKTKDNEYQIRAEHIHVLDNNSNGKETLQILTDLENMGCIVHRFKENYGHLIWTLPQFWDQMPEYFVISDPDLQYNDELPSNFLEILKEISELYGASRVGFALSLKEKDEFYVAIYAGGRTIYDWESQFWNYKGLTYKGYDTYYAEIDTTFFLGCKSRWNSPRHIRVASNFTCKHLPWSKKSNCELGFDRLQEFYLQSSKFSTTGRLIMSHIKEINKRSVKFHVEMDGSNRDEFWNNIYSEWEEDTFDVFDEHVKPNTTVIDIGSWIGPTVLYCGKLGANIVAVEADKEAVFCLRNNLNLNKINYKLIEKAIYKDNNGVFFGENVFRDDGLNASTSQIVSSDSNKTKYKIESITFKEIIESVKDLNEDNKISLIKVDIEGGEEHILKDLLEFRLGNIVPMYISFHFSWWSEEGKKSFVSSFSKIFSDLDQDVKNVIEEPFTSILF